jgi:hypothetical protein
MQGLQRDRVVLGKRSHPLRLIVTRSQASNLLRHPAGERGRASDAGSLGLVEQLEQLRKIREVTLPVRLGR